MIEVTETVHNIGKKKEEETSPDWLWNLFPHKSHGWRGRGTIDMLVAGVAATSPLTRGRLTRIPMETELWKGVAARLLVTVVEVRMVDGASVHMHLSFLSRCLDILQHVENKLLLCGPCVHYHVHVINVHGW